MSGILYLKNQLPALLLHLLCMAAAFLFLTFSGSQAESILFLLMLWAIVLAAAMAVSYQLRRRKLNRLLQMCENLKERYLISELMEEPQRADDLVFYRILKMLGKSMLEQIGSVNQERMEYKDYIEQWIHEVKTPITAIQLLCENNRSPLTREILAELEKVSRYTDQALYYARSEYTEKDYSVREIRLFQCVHQAIADNKRLLLQNHVSVQLEETPDTVFSDDKWIRFILNQLIANAVKYRGDNPALVFQSAKKEGAVILTVQDNGIGIPEADLGRIFEKGFTGANGHGTSQSTGIGLYLCRRLCGKLGILISAESGEYGTRMHLTFPINHFIHQVQD